MEPDHTSNHNFPHADKYSSRKNNKTHLKDSRIRSTPRARLRGNFPTNFPNARYRVAFFRRRSLRG